MLETASLA